MTVKLGSSWLLGATLGTLCLAGCTAEIDGTPLGSATGSGQGTWPVGGAGSLDPLTQVDTESCEEAPWEMPLRRLTPAQYRRTLGELLPSVTPSNSFPGPAAGAGFEHFASANTSSVAATRAIMEAAERAAVQAVSDLDSLLPCSPSEDGERACAGQFVRELASEAYRRPALDAEVSRLMALYDAAADADFQERIALLIVTVLQAPQFVYLPDYGRERDDGTWQLDDHALASRLSYLLWDAPPDETLLTAAADGELVAAEGREAQATRMLDDPRAEDAIIRFGREWLQFTELDDTTKSRERFPGFNALRDSMHTESERFLRFALLGQASLNSLLTSRTSFVDAPLAALYGVDSDSEGPGDFVRVQLPEDRKGVLTRAGLLSVLAWSEEPSPVFRGLFVRTRLLCQSIPPPPPVAATVEPEGESVRERAEFLVEDETCGTCHSLMDSIGLGMMTYDAQGRATSDARLDTQGEVVNAGDASGSFEGTGDLANMLAASESVHACAVKQVMQFALAKSVARDENLCSRARMNEAFFESGGDFKALWMDLVGRSAFARRPAQERP